MFFAILADVIVCFADVFSLLFCFDGVELGREDARSNDINKQKGNKTRKGYLTLLVNPSLHIRLVLSILSIVRHC